ncbi:MAG TPA: LptF/LptG family permease [Caulobacteraceae bacterium]|nr:LptF/LptG family permease [Caulobacteraceae bacterium]
MRLGHIERYVLGRSLTGVGAALGVIAFIIMLIDFVELSRTVGTRARDISVLDLFGLALLQSPAVILLVLPFAFLFGVLFAYMNLNRRSELIAMRAAGVSAWRFILPAAMAAAVIGLVTVTALHPVASQMHAAFERRQTALMENYLPTPPKAIWLPPQGDGKNQIIIRAGSRVGPGVRLKDVTLLVYRREADGGLRFTRRIDADEARLRNGQFSLIGVRSATPGALGVRFGSVTVPSTLNMTAALERFAAPDAVPFWDLPMTIVRTERAGFSATGYRLQFHQLLATPLMFAGMSVLAAAFSLGLLRLGGLAALAGSGVTLGFVFFFMNQLCTSLGRAAVMPPMLAAWTPPALALLAGFTLLCYTEDG